MQKQPGDPSPEYASSEDPDGKAKAIGTRWVRSDKPTFAVQKGERLLACSYLMFHVGDFVDVTATVDASCVLNPGGRDHYVDISMERVILLQPKAVRVVSHHALSHMSTILILY